MEKDMDLTTWEKDRIIEMMQSLNARHISIIYQIVHMDFIKYQ